ncbi:carbonyl reductase [NADPH] 1-like [Agrilus planipennis]|uniref:carbonyl reductase (NADPH) n=1 Tax=Agrilus planipennis TaxID=224129 RepID=A0A1W4X692_AGRPL|nr:carbonyl reductase [NADPH] 1-like [Agrilus planipennis]
MSTPLKKIAVVTGSNKGIGYAIVKGLCEKYDGLVYLTARDVGRGEAAVKKLNELGFKPLFHQLDITSKESIKKLRDDIVREHGGIDLLINNAAIAYKTDATEPFGEQAENTIKVNYFATLEVCNVLFPILRQNARVINLSSSAGRLSRIPSSDIRDKFKDSKLTVPKLNELMQEFVRLAKEGADISNTWGNSTYVVSKVGLSALTFIQQREFDAETPSRNISVNCCHPGYVDTDMTSHKGPLTVEEGARSSLYLALENHGLKGKFVWEDCSLIEWTTA